MWIVKWWKVVCSPRTICWLLMEMVELLQVVKDHPEWGDQAKQLLQKLNDFVNRPS